MTRNYDLIAPLYDSLVTLIFGKALRNAQTYFLHLIPPNANILIAGGGTGWILEEIAAIHPQDLHIDYVDSSAKMIAIAAKRNVGNNEVNFIHQSVFHFATHKQYNIIITPFFFDNFKQETAQQAFDILHQTLQPNGLWLYTDFQIKIGSPSWQKAILFMMYKFFRIAANIETTRLPDVASCFHRHQYQLMETKTFFRRFIFTSVYKKQIQDNR